MKYDAVVIGGGPAGIISAVTARKYYPKKKILVIKSIDPGIVPCGIPYMFTTLESPEDNALGDMPLKKNGIDIMVDEVNNIDKEKRRVSTKDGKNIEYDKLIIATGSNGIMPPVEGNDKMGIYIIHKEMEHLKNLKADITKAKNIIIIGGGFIGVEFADELSRLKNANVYLIESSSQILERYFDPEFSVLAHETLSINHVKIIIGKKVMRFNGSERVESVTLSNDEAFPADVVIIGTGARPNSELASDAGIEVGKSGGILVDEYLRTSEKGIFAVGDCAEKKDYFTREKTNVMLASTATAEARIAGANLWELKVVRENKGTIATYSTNISGLVLASAGINETAASNEGFDVIVGNAECPDKHPSAMPGANKVKVKLIFSKQSEILLGGQVAGGGTVGEIINIIGLAIQKTTSITELETLQIATHPKLTAAPTMYPLITAAQDALSKNTAKP